MLVRFFFFFFFLNIHFPTKLAAVGGQNGCIRAGADPWRNEKTDLIPNYIYRWDQGHTWEKVFPSPVCLSSGEDSSRFGNASIWDSMSASRIGSLPQPESPRKLASIMREKKKKKKKKKKKLGPRVLIRGCSLRAGDIFLNVIPILRRFNRVVTKSSVRAIPKGGTYNLGSRIRGRAIRFL